MAEARAGFRPGRRTPAELISLGEALRRVPARPVTAPHPLPGFARSTVDGYAVRAADTYGVSEGLPGYLTVTGAVLMGTEPDISAVPLRDWQLLDWRFLLPAGVQRVGLSVQRAPQ